MKCMMLLLHVIGFSIFTQSTNAFYGSFSNVPTTNINCLLANSAGNTVMAPSPQVGQQAELICNVELRQGGHAFCCCYISWQGQPVVTYGIAQGPSLLPQKNCILINAGRDTPPNLNWTYVIGNVANASGQAMGRPSTQIDNSEANTKMATSTISSIAGGENHVQSSVPNENRNGHTVSHENICSSKFSVFSVLFVIFIAECF